jgi:hypothetical protein
LYNFLERPRGYKAIAYHIVMWGYRPFSGLFTALFISTCCFFLRLDIYKS